MNPEKLIELMSENPKLIPTLISELVNEYKPAFYAIYVRNI